MISHKRGDSFDIVASIPGDFADAYFVGWDVSSQIRDMFGTVQANLACNWLDPATTRNLSLQALDTSSWAVGSYMMDVKFSRPGSPPYVVRTDTIELHVMREVTA